MGEFEKHPSLHLSVFAVHCTVIEGYVLYKIVIARRVQKTYFLKVSKPIDTAQVYIFIDAINMLYVC